MPSDLLNYWLGQCYAAEVIKGDRSGAAITALTRQLQANQALATEAQTVANAISDDLAKQDFISKNNKEFLMRALTAAQAQ